jgi:hypothetical protein
VGVGVLVGAGNGVGVCVGEGVGVRVGFGVSVGFGDGVEVGFGSSVGSGCRVGKTVGRSNVGTRRVGVGVGFCGVVDGIGVSVRAGVAPGVPGPMVFDDGGVSLVIGRGVATAVPPGVALGTEVPVAGVVATGVMPAGSTRRGGAEELPCWSSPASSSAAARTMSASSGSMRRARESTE